ncbi:MAG: right-handed parallel beta-helix repeat-containing protein, partial [Phycisphaerae bacterium]|nr:right-handed parallel beta-helix repeat-containing protein [Saprospiraceae bacterium]
ERDTATDFGGGGVYGWQATTIIKNTTFRDNYAPVAAGMYLDGREFDSQIIIDSCLFERNIASGYGATSLFQFRTNYTLSNSIFRENVAPTSGAAIYNSDATIFTTTNCLFEANTGTYAACVANYGLGCNGTFESCTFTNNTATQGGGAVSSGFEANVNYHNCTFTSNKAAFAGAIFTQNDGTRLGIENCFFSENTTTGSGGCIYVNPKIPTNIRNSEFTFNTGDFGGVLQAFGDSPLTIENSIFQDNFASTQGAAFNLNDTKAEITNCLFARNLNVGVGAGGAMSINSSDSLFCTVKAVNCTFANNDAVLGAGIAQWEAPLGDAKLSLLNCLFQNPAGENYSIEQGNPEVISLNGNQSSDASLQSYLIGSKDANNLAVTFADPGNDDFRLTMGPAVDGGVAAGAPATDLLGNPRIGLPDRGCYELGINSVKGVGFQVLSMQCSPNPANERTVLNLQNDLNGTAEIAIWNQAGQRVATYMVTKSSPEFSFPLELGGLPAGTYRIQCRMGVLLHEGSFVKM